jgi:hypothetical protein
MNQILLNSISFQPDISFLMEKFRLPQDSPHIEDLKALVAEAGSIGRPKVLYGIGYVEIRGEDFVVIDGARFKSRVLRVNLEKAHRVFPYLATGGRELDKWASSLEDVVHRFWADALCEMALGTALQALNSHIQERYLLNRFSSMSPGSLGDWPIEEQIPLFALLGNTAETVGVTLTESLLMVPLKSVSGILFPSEEGFESCQLCPRDNCPGRRTPYDKDLYKKRYQL